MSAGASVASPVSYAFVPQQGVSVSGMSAPSSSYSATPQASPNAGYPGAGWSQGDSISRSPRGYTPGLRPEAGTADMMIAPQPQTLQANQAATATDDVDALKASNESEKDVFYMCFGMAGFAAVAFPVFGELMKYRQKLQLKEFGDAEQGKFEAARKNPQAIEKQEWKGITEQFDDVVKKLAVNKKIEAPTLTLAEQETPEIVAHNRANALDALYQSTKQKMQEIATRQNAEVSGNAHAHVEKHIKHYFGSLENYVKWTQKSRPAFSSWKNKFPDNEAFRLVSVAERDQHHRFLSEVVDHAIKATKLHLEAVR